MNQTTTELNPVTRIVKVHRRLKYEVGRRTRVPDINIQELDPLDVVETPIMAELFCQASKPMDPAKDCIEGYRKDCRKYGILSGIINRYLKETSGRERKHDLNSPDVSYFNSQPKFCQVCILLEHKKRKRRFKWLR